jgi:anti-anti-sigma factor
MGSSGIGELVRSCVRVASAGGEMKLIHVPSRIANLLQITKLRRVFEVFAEIVQAVQWDAPSAGLFRRLRDQRGTV